MYKPGQLVTLNGTVYRISKCVYSKGYKACLFCQQQNIKPPCIDRFDYPKDKNTFDLRTCQEKMPEMCIPKKVFSKSS